MAKTIAELLALFPNNPTILDIGREITPVDVAQMMILLKVARAKGNQKHQDNWIDVAGYAACAGEIAAEIYGE